ncbi:hypothetical protein KDA00_03700 [Candidatus Saccharibacteria bacterium]|nr:hypothetical protein [Candidatus Saccharibacteria bacterium]
MKYTPQTVTSEEKRAIILSLRQKFHRNGELLLPDNELYPQAFTPEKLELATKKILVWLGSKPRNVTTKIDKSRDSYFEYDRNTIVISFNDKHASKPIIGVAILSKMCVAILFEKKKIRYDDELIESALIELGLGLLVINSIDSDDDIRQKLSRILGLKQMNISKDILSHYSPNEFVRLFSSYISMEALPNSVVIEHTFPWNQPLIEDSNKPSNYRFEKYVINEKDNLTQSRIKFGLVVTAIISIAILAVFLFNEKPKNLTAELQIKKENIEVLNFAYQKCKSSLAKKENEYPTGDFEMQRILELHNSRCISIKNKHDYLVREYNLALKNEELL